MNVNMFIKLIIPILGAIVTYLMVPFIMQKTSKEQRENVLFWIKIAVNAAEQMQEAGLIEIPKKEYVVEYLISKGIKISMKDLDVLIEAAVKELNMLQYLTLD